MLTQFNLVNMSEVPAKIKIDKDGAIEVEGSEEFVFKILLEHRELFTTGRSDSPKVMESKDEPETSARASR